ncbi:MAG: tetratricopeptide repeat protein [Deltaproteobacteria bacterium]|jgi:hypothetical protein|nr:tetratricopeptide repeat protein [Deltaproteobacteria bacterium]
MSTGHKTLLTLICLGCLTALGCAPKPIWHSLLPPDIEVGEFTGPGGETLTTELRRRLSPKPMSGRTQILSGSTQFEHKTAQSQETVIKVTKKTNGQSVTETIPITIADARLIAKWTLTPTGSAKPTRQGQTEEVWRRSFGGYLAQEGVTDSTPEEPDKTRDNLARTLAALMVTELGPNHTPYNLVRSYDKQSLEAQSLVDADNWEAAAKIWQNIIKENPIFAPALYNLGLYHERSGRLAEAWEYYRQAYRAYNDFANREALTRATDMMFRLGRPPWIRHPILFNYY